MEVLARGAEAVIYREGNRVIKERVKKRYRIEELDVKLRRERTKKEARIMKKLKSLGILVPEVLEVEDFRITMEYIDGVPLRDVLDEKPELAERVGEYLAKMHKNGIQHGDPTTSNFILKEGKVYVIDFGLADYTNRIEDFATDVLLFERSVEAGHNDVFHKVMEHFRRGYSKEFDKWKEVFKRKEEIKKRGRYQKRKSS